MADVSVKSVKKEEKIDVFQFIDNMKTFDRIKRYWIIGHFNDGVLRTMKEWKNIIPNK